METDKLRELEAMKPWPVSMSVSPPTLHWVLRAELGARSVNVSFPQASSVHLPQDHLYSSHPAQLNIHSTWIKSGQSHPLSVGSEGIAGIIPGDSNMRGPSDWCAESLPACSRQWSCFVRGSLHYFKELLPVCSLQVSHTQSHTSPGIDSWASWTGLWRAFLGVLSEESGVLVVREMGEEQTRLSRGGMECSQEPSYSHMRPLTHSHSMGPQTPLSPWSVSTGLSQEGLGVLWTCNSLHLGGFNTGLHGNFHSFSLWGYFLEHFHLLSQRDCSRPDVKSTWPR